MNKMAEALRRQSKALRNNGFICGHNPANSRWIGRPASDFTADTASKKLKEILWGAAVTENQFF